MPTFTALYERREDAEAVQAQLTKLGVFPDARAQIAGKHTPGLSSHHTEQSKGFWDSLKGFFVSHEDRGVYEEGVRQGGYLLAVLVDHRYEKQVHDLLESSNAVDVAEREEQYRRAGTLPMIGVPAAAPSTITDGAHQTIPIVEEKLEVGRRRVERPGIRVRSYVVEEPVQQEVQLREEHVTVKREPVDRQVSTAAAAGELFREATVEVAAQGEEAVVTKQARVVEEVVVGKSEAVRVEEIDETVKRTEVQVESDDARSTVVGKRR